MNEYFFTQVNGTCIIARLLKSYCAGHWLELDYLVGRVEKRRDRCWNLREIIGASTDPLNARFVEILEQVYNARNLEKTKAKYELNQTDRKLNNLKVQLENGALCPQAAEEIGDALVNFYVYEEDLIVYSQMGEQFLKHIAKALLIFNGKKLE